jgi:hypothetical protein
MQQRRSRRWLIGCWCSICKIVLSLINTPHQYIPSPDCPPRLVLTGAAFFCGVGVPCAGAVALRRVILPRCRPCAYSGKPERHNAPSLTIARGVPSPQIAYAVGPATSDCRYSLGKLRCSSRCYPQALLFDTVCLRSVPAMTLGFAPEVAHLSGWITPRPRCNESTPF